MSRKKVTIIFSSIAAFTLFLVIIGVLFDKTEAEKLNGLTELFDVSANGMVAYVSYEEGKPGIYLKTEQTEELAVQLEEEKDISDIAFSPNGTTLAYTVNDKNVEESIDSVVQLLDVRSLDSKELFKSEALITELEFDPKDENRLFYLGARTFENYSPVARAYPHDIDIYSYLLSEEKQTRHTEMESYSMNSLNISHTENIVYIQKDDDAHAETAEDMFEMNQRIFQIPLGQPEEISIISDPDREIDIYDFAIVPGKEAMVFQSISNANAGGTFEYELYYYDWDRKEETRLTDLQEYAGTPIIADDKKVYFIVDKQFAHEYPDHHLYKMDLDGENVVEIDLEYD